MRWMIAAAFLVQVAQVKLVAQERAAVPLEASHTDSASVASRSRAGGVGPTGTDAVTNEDLVSFLNEEPESLTTMTPNADEADSLLWKLVAVLCFVLMFCAFLAIRHGHAKAGLTDPASGQLSLVASLPIGNRSVLHLVSAAGSVLVVASDNTGVKSIVRLPEQFDDLVDAARQPFSSEEVRHA